MDTNTVQQVGDMIDMLGQKLSPAIELAAQKMGVAAEYVFTLFVKQAVVESVVWLTVVVFLMITGLVLTKQSIKLFKSSSAVAHRNEGLCIVTSLACAATGFAYFASIMVFLTNVNTIISGIINPQYMAIQNLITLVK